MQAYNGLMEKSDRHSRRDFLQGRAAARTLADQAQAWVDKTSDLLGVVTAAETTLHLRASRRAMACEFVVQFHEADRDAAEGALSALDLIEELETQMTIYRDQSEVLEINKNASLQPVQVEPRLYALFELAKQINCETHRAFDITSGPLSRAWGFLKRAGQFPGEAEIAAALARVGGAQVQLDAERRTIRFLQSETEINLNSIGKGYALDRAAELLDEQDVNDYLWHGGGSSVFARGRNRADTRQAWTLGLRHPLDTTRRIAEFYLRDQGLATAGGGTQFFEHEGRHLSHIIDPRTGWPVEGVLTATAIAPSAAEADALATAFFVMEREEVAAYCAAHAGYAALLVCPGKNSGTITIHDFGMTTATWTQLR